MFARALTLIIGAVDFSQRGGYFFHVNCLIGLLICPNRIEIFNESLNGESLLERSLSDLGIIG